MPDIPLGKCDCCRRERAIGVASVPGVPMSVAWCVSCLRADVIPPGLAVAVVATCGGYEHVDEGYLDGCIATTLFHFDIDIDRFLADVAREIAELDAYEGASP